MGVWALGLAAALWLLGGCADQRPPIHTVDRVNLERFMGDWYVIAAIPTSLEENAYNAVESYRLAGEGRVETTFTFREGGFDGERKTYHPTGFVEEGTGNAVWGMQFFWPIKAEYRVISLSEDYSQTIIGRQKRDYAWIMARSPQIPESQYRAMVDFLRQEGYDVGKLRKVPQRWD
ncbi:MAG TPA: lipocalin family protein [Gammaproteobacteria bacterium]|nr:lipocalin family protein [Gammaproteobacteria bacterium]